MRDEQDNTCLTCDFWLPNANEKPPYNELTCGECRRYPPSVPLIIKTTELGVEVHDRGSNDGVPLMGWPETYAAEWCGEWRADFDTMVERM